MPAYIFDQGCDHDRWNALDAFTQAYIECAFWLGDDSDDIPERTFAELSDDALQSIKQDCDNFRAIPEVATALVNVDDEQAGHDFFLTRNHHGAGFWDRGLGERGDVLTKWAHTFSESDLYLGDDEKLYVS